MIFKIIPLHYTGGAVSTFRDLREKLICCACFRKRSKKATQARLQTKRAQSAPKIYPRALAPFLRYEGPLTRCLSRPILPEPQNSVRNFAK